MTRAGSDEQLPTPSPRWVRWFSGVARRYLRRHLNAVRLSRHGAALPDADAPWVIYLNHPAWWDPLVGTLLASMRLADRSHWAVIERDQLRRYRFFNRLGFIGVEPASTRGARRLLSLAAPLAAQPRATLWLTPQGRFSDPRERPLRLAGGLGRLAARMPGAYFVPLAIEYPFWQERHPEALLRFGEPLRPADITARRPEVYTARLAERLACAADALAGQAVARDAAGFVTLLDGRRGVGGVYDGWRRVAARWRGERFVAGHDRGSCP